jgi:RNA polymerase sigma-70 factor (ECF subfamily)
MVAVMVAVTDGERITELFTVANPDKLGVTNAAAGASW